MTFFGLLKVASFFPPLILAVLAGKEAGGVGIMIGMGIGSVTGGLAYYVQHLVSWTELRPNQAAFPRVDSRTSTGVRWPWRSRSHCSL